MQMCHSVHEQASRWCEQVCYITLPKFTEAGASFLLSAHCCLFAPKDSKELSRNVKEVKCSSTVTSECFPGQQCFPFLCSLSVCIRAGYTIVFKTFISTSLEHFSLVSCTVCVVATSHCQKALLGFSLCCLYSIPFPFLLSTALQDKLNIPPSLYSNNSAIGRWLSWVPSHCWAKLYIFIFLNLIFPHKSIPSGP